MITLYALKQSRAYRIAWLLELLNLEYDVEIIDRQLETGLAPDSLRKIHPLGKSPILKDDSLVLAESGAIAEYLVSRYGAESALKPASNSDAFPNYLFWLHYAEGSLMPLLVMSLVFRRVDEKKMPFFIKPVARKITDGVRESFLHPQLQLHLQYVESRLAGKQWLLGDTLTLADVMMSFPLQAATQRTSLDLPHITDYVRRIEANPAYRRAEQRIGNFSLL
ncbi:MAG: glutathione S-transferase [Neisseria sp.]|uniref:glutathione S-transferase n=1 Tax=Neisseria sp. TaxID=192066 RepID=UPI0026DC832C|nr:glutathione S-transferase [Neisseria sp.]MDO4641242.1 glutathione S-transferase [Neisseria sp.]